MDVRRTGLRFGLLCAAAYIGSSFAPTGAKAQDQAPATQAGQLEEIVVTSTKRTENLRAVPQSISVITGTQLQAMHVDDYADLARNVPGLSFTNSGGPGLSNLEIRGISSTIGQPTVSIYLDDTPITIRNNSFYAGQPEPLLFDLAQSEVLRGPQGTLYGASSMGGTIRLVSNPVNLSSYQGSAYSELSETEHGGLNYVFRGVVNVPIVTETLGLRIGYETTQDSGYVDHADLDGTVDKRGINGDRSNVLKAAFLWDVTPDLTITSSVFLQRTHIADTGLVDLDNSNYVTTKLVPEGGTDTMAIPSIKINYDFDWADLTSVSSYAYRHFPRTTDGTYFNSEYVGFFLDDILDQPGKDGKLHGDALGALPGPVYNSLNARQATEEIRLVSKPYDPNGDGLPITWIAGLYYSDAKYLGTSAQYITDFNQTFAKYYSGTPAEVLGAPTPNNLFYDFVNRLDDRQYAAFGELAYYVLPEFKLTAGLRYLYGRDSATNVSGGFFASTPFSSGNTKAYALTPKFAATYDVSDSTTTYVNVSKGYRLGGINAPVPAEQCAVDLHAFGLDQAPDNYQPDKLWNYEVGAKSRFFDNQLSVNVSAYDIEWDKIQLDVPLKTCGFDYFANVGHARSVGFETEILERLTPDLTLGFTGVYDDATFTQAEANLGIRNGDIVPGSPKWSVTLSADYEKQLTDLYGFFARANWQFIGTSHGTFVRDNQDYQRPNYNLFGASIGLTYDNWEFSIFTKNLFDEKKVIQKPADNFVAEGYTPVPQIFGLSAEVKF
jgi:outer membrane receptor protein involved in Fe transport